MNNVIEGYVKAVMGLEKGLLRDLVAKKEILKACFENSDFHEVLTHPFLSSKEKVNFVIECLGGVDAKIKALLLMMAENGRLPFLKELVKKVESELNVGECRGILYSCEPIKSDLLELFKSQLQKKIGYQIQINEVLWDKPEVKCVIDSLGLEISFSKESFDRDLKKFILDSFK